MVLATRQSGIVALRGVLQNCVRIVAFERVAERIIALLLYTLEKLGQKVILHERTIGVCY